jgi:hypothetical protein
LCKFPGRFKGAYLAVVLLNALGGGVGEVVDVGYFLPSLDVGLTTVNFQE